MQYNCPDDYFNPAATLFFNSEDTIIKALIAGFSYEEDGVEVLTTSTIGVFTTFWLFFATMTYGSAVPSGIFFYSIVIGIGIGTLYENIRVNMFGVEGTELTTLPIIIGAACMMTATTRLSYSVVVIMLEAANAFNLAVPIIIAVFVSKLVSDGLNRGMFDREIRDANIPILTGSIPNANR